MSEQPTKQAEREVIFGFGKRLRGLAYEQALQFLINRDGKECKKCKKDNAGQTIDHVNPDLTPETGLHSSKNLQILCFSCNSAKGHTKQSYLEKREKESIGSEATSEETRRALKMRPRWNNWLEKERPQRITPTALSRRAVHELGMGSSVTYMRYINEDISGDILGLTEVEGTQFVYYVGKDTRMIREQHERESGA